MPELFMAVYFAALADPIRVTVFARKIIIRYFRLLDVTA
jgi:hypothetical protein